jgi:threonine aldolase
MDQAAHLYLLEGGAPFALSGVHPRLLPGIRGVFTPADVLAAAPIPHPFSPKHLAPPARLLCVESTHNLGAGKIWSLDQIEAVAAAGRARGLALHLDGARLWNASAATGTAEVEYAAPFDSVGVCFSKGLGAPVGSVLAGSKAFIERARRFRAQFGGAMRQAGIIAAGALHALRYHRARLVEDHEHARLIADAIAGLPGIDLDPSTVETNIIRFRVTNLSAGDFVVRLHEAGLHVLPSGADGVRALTHLGITREDAIQAADIIRRIVRR